MGLRTDDAGDIRDVTCPTPLAPLPTSKSTPHGGEGFLAAIVLLNELGAEKPLLLGGDSVRAFSESAEVGCGDVESRGILGPTPARSNTHFVRFLRPVPSAGWEDFKSHIEYRKSHQSLNQ